MNFKFYRILNADMISKLQLFKKENDLVEKEVTDLIKSVGANVEKSVNRDVMTITYFRFDQPPCLSDWKKVVYQGEVIGYNPRLTSKRGKQIQQKRDSIGMFYSYEAVLFYPERFTPAYCIPSPEIVGCFDCGVFFVKSKQSDEIIPPELFGMFTEVKEWEVLKFMDEINSK